MAEEGKVDRRVSKPMAVHLEDEEANARQAAVQALQAVAEKRDSQVTKAMAVRLEHNNSIASMAAVQALQVVAEKGDSQASKALAAHRDDEDLGGRTAEKLEVI